HYTGARPGATPDQRSGARRHTSPGPEQLQQSLSTELLGFLLLQGAEHHGAGVSLAAVSEVRQPDRAMTQSAEPWYVAEGKRGQRLLEQGHVGRATDVFKAVLARLGEAPSYGRAVILGRLGRCFHMSGQADLAVAHLREAMGVAGRLAPSDGVKGLRGTLRSELGDALRASGRYGKAKQAYEAALKIAEELKDRRAQGVDLGRLGAVALAEGNLEDRKSTRLNSSHVSISYAVFCLKKK